MTAPTQHVEDRRWPMLMLVLIVVALSVTTGVMWRQASSMRGSIDRIDQTVDRIEASSTRTEAAADELVAFVREIQAQQPCAPTTTQETTTTQQAVALLLDVLCASSDPARQKACAELTQPGG
jgi:hypothetical protein